MSIDVTQTQGQNQDSLEKTRELSRGMLNAKGYELLNELGTGTYGVVWLARDVRTSVSVAIKFFARGTGEQWQTLQEEVRQLAQLHAAPNIVRLLDVEIESRPPYFVMDFAENGSLAVRLKKGAVSVGEAVEIFRQIAQALAYVHAKGILHCDLKPGNILLDATGRALVADFGQAHLASDTSPALGTFFYMAPEQADLAGAFPDTRWDVYALGAILYAMLTGRPPREDSTLKQELENTAELNHRLEIYRDKVLSSAQPRGHRTLAGVDRALAEIVDRCLELEPEKRFRDAQTVLNALRRRERHKRQRSLIAFGLLVPVVLLLVMGAMAWGLGKKILDETQTALLKESSQGDLASAQLVASNVDSRFQKYIDAAQNVAANRELTRIIQAGRQQGWESHDALVQFLEETYAQHLRAIDRHAPEGPAANDSDTAPKSEVYRWSFTDAGGIMRGNAPFFPAHLGKQWSWRDWFSGQGDQTDQSRIYPPIREVHISQPFFAKTGFPAVTITAPVWAAAEKGSESSGAADSTPDSSPELLGVLGISLDLNRLNDWIGKLRIPHGKVVLINERRHILHYGKIDDPYRRLWLPKLDSDPPTWSSPLFDKAIRTDAHEDEEVAGYVDPLDGKTYLAGHARLPALKMVAIVQHERNAVLQRGNELRADARRKGLYGVVVAGLLVPGMWGFLLWIIRREEQADA